MKYIFLDIDGTLFSQKCGIPKSAYEAVELARKAGHKIFICTGRSCCMLDHVEGIAYDGVVAAAGAYVELDGKIVFEKNIEDEQLQKIMAYCGQHHINYILEGKKGVYMDSDIREYYETGAGKNTGGHEFFRQKMVHGIESYDPETEVIYKFSIYAESREILQKMEEQLKEQYHFVYGSANGEYLQNAEVMRKESNKAEGIRTVLKYYNGKMEDTVGIGDSMNDLEMLKECGTGIAMGNADENLKTYADYVTDSVEQDGIYKAFAHYGLLG